ncbi:MAG: acetyl-CoA carboxylase biotin carboxylase subunit [Nanoarchaeota archaeon]|nr:acetyl-CoA carboxylase biotin carboxylase subunit [Nanoarchaeota archaeon]
MVKTTKILIANRAEIALRIIRACKELNIKSVAIYSDIDKDSDFVKLANEAYPLNGNESKETYLNIEKIISIAKKAKVDAIHPGYGFLSEEPLLPKRASEEKILFIGPNCDTMKRLGLKVESKKLADKLHIPRSPGENKIITNIDEGKVIAKKIGYPVMIKATGGGGGKGMRLIKNEKELEDGLISAQNEAKASFSNSGVFIEKFIDDLRHIEIQIIADSFGNVVHFFERECSIQRKHQKLVEEAPSSFLTQEERMKLGDYAVKLAQEVGYLGAGTVEFICDNKRNFYFCEMNTRIQVEHGVTELATGHDLVKEQINVCLGKKLSVKQSDIKLIAHAFECRINAEDPQKNFFPSIGTINLCKLPQGDGIRIDGAVKTDYEISQYYDSMIMKLMSYGRNRTEAIKRMQIFLDETQITGIKSNLELHKIIFDNKNFQKGNISANFLDKNKIIEKIKNIKTNDEEINELNAALAALAISEYMRKSKGKEINSWMLSSRE